jgi:hypothetical protein
MIINLSSAAAEDINYNITEQFSPVVYVRTQALITDNNIITANNIYISNGINIKCTHARARAHTHTHTHTHRHVE